MQSPDSSDVRTMSAPARPPDPAGALAPNTHSAPAARKARTRQRRVHSRVGAIAARGVAALAALYVVAILIGIVVYKAAIADAVLRDPLFAGYGLAVALYIRESLCHQRPLSPYW